MELASYYVVYDECSASIANLIISYCERGQQSNIYLFSPFLTFSFFDYYQRYFVNKRNGKVGRSHQSWDADHRPLIPPKEIKKKRAELLLLLRDLIFMRVVVVVVVVVSFKCCLGKKTQRAIKRKECGDHDDDNTQTTTRTLKAWKCFSPF